jgi:hypothetical protein
MGTCFEPAFVESYVRLGIENGIPVMFFGGHMQHVGAAVGSRRELVLAIASTLWEAGLPVLDDLVQSPTRGTTYEERRQSFIELLDTLQPGVTQIILHCTETGDSFASISGSGPMRQAELQLMLDPVVAAAIDERNIVLTDWRELLERRRNAADDAGRPAENPPENDRAGQN